MKKGALSEAAIRSRVDERSFARWKRYYEQDAIVNARMEGHTLRARCWGSGPRPYQLWVQLGGDGIIAADCCLFVRRFNTVSKFIGCRATSSCAVGTSMPRICSPFVIA